MPRKKAPLPTPSDAMAQELDEIINRDDVDAAILVVVIDGKVICRWGCDGEIAALNAVGGANQMSQGVTDWLARHGGVRPANAVKH